MSSIPEIKAHDGGVSIPVIGLGMYSSPPVPDEVTKTAVLDAIEAGYRHFDTATVYFTEQALGDGITEALRQRMVDKREDLFITTKLWLTDAHPDLVLPALQATLMKMKLEYLDLYLIHWPVSAKPGPITLPVKKEDFCPLDLKGVWAAMEQCLRLGLVTAIGVSNFTCKRLELLMSFATIPPAVNQVEVSPTWQNRKLIEFCKRKEILLMAYSPLGGARGGVIKTNVLQQIAEAKGKTVAQVALRWVYEQGIAVIAKSFNKDRMKENLEIFSWELSSEDHEKISMIPQERTCSGFEYTSPFGPFHTVEEIWDEEA